MISRWQHIEYVIGFNIDRRVQDVWQAMTTVPGAIGAYRRVALEQVGGVSADTLAEDTDLTIALGRARWRVVYLPAARAWTDAPVTFGQLWRQRYRWSYGTMQSLWKHRHATVERGPSGHVGRVGLLVTALFQIILPLLAPMVDVYLIYGLLFLEPVTTIVTWSAVLALQLVAGVVAFRLEGEPRRGLLLLPLQQIVYRQLMYAVLIQSVISERLAAALAEGSQGRGLQRRAAGPERGRHEMRLQPLVIGSVLLAVVSCSVLPSAKPTLSSLPAVVDPTVTGTVNVFVTFYGGIDNDPPGSDEIAHPNGRHPAAGGTGTFADPITLATDPDELPIGTVVYHPGLRKYFVMEDECDTCIEEWRAERRPHIDLWVSSADDERVLACEDALTPEQPVPVEINPPTGRPVDPRPLYDTDAGCTSPG